MGRTVRSRLRKAIHASGLLVACCVLLQSASADTIFVSDYGGHAVHEYTMSGTLIRDLTLGFQFNPYDLALDGAGSLFVANYIYGEVERFDVYSGDYLGAVGNFAPGDYHPLGLAMGPDGGLYFGDNNVSIFRIDLSANTTAAVYSPASAAGTDLVFLPDGRLLTNDGASKVLFDGTAGPGNVFATGFGTPWGMVLGPDGQLYVVDRSVGDKSVRVVGASGGTAVPFTSVNSLSDGRFLAFDNSGNLWVTDSGANRVKEFDGATGALVTSFISLNGFGIAIAPDQSDVPEPGTAGDVALAVAAGFFAPRKRRRPTAA